MSNTSDALALSKFSDALNRFVGKQISTLPSFHQGVVLAYDSDTGLASVSIDGDPTGLSAVVIKPYAPTPGDLVEVRKQQGYLVVHGPTVTQQASIAKSVTTVGSGGSGGSGGGSLSLDSGWHYLGAPGEPAYGTGVTPYDTVMTTWSPLRFRRDAGGCVFLDGLANTTAVTGTGTVICVLPYGFRPAYTLQFLIVSSGVMARLTVSPSGAVTLTTNIVASWFGLNNITFMAEDIQFVNWQTITLTGGWSNYTGGAGGWPVARYYIDNVGDIHLSGCITGGGIGTPNALTTFPVGMRPDAHTMFAQVANPGTGGAMCRVDIRSDGLMNVDGYSGGGNNTWISLDGIVVPNIGGNWGTAPLLNSWVEYTNGFAP